MFETWHKEYPNEAVTYCGKYKFSQNVLVKQLAAIVSGATASVRMHEDIPYVMVAPLCSNSFGNECLVYLRIESSNQVRYIALAIILVSQSSKGNLNLIADQTRVINTRISEMLTRLAEEIEQN